MTALVVLAAPLLASSPAAAVYRDDGDDPGQGLSVLGTIGWFVLAPAALFLLIAVLVYATNRDRDERYRPGSGWFSAPVWFNGPPTHERPKDVDERPTQATTSGGGASARW